MQFWYFEIAETYRKLFLASALSVISPGTTKQLVIAELFCVFSVIFYVIVSPYESDELAITSSICQLQVCFILFISILLKEDVAISNTFINISIIFAVCFVLGYELFWCVVEFCPLPKRAHDFIENFGGGRRVVPKSAEEIHPSPHCE
jgi:hypothetical protein